MTTSLLVTLNALRQQWGLQRLYSPFTVSECMRIQTIKHLAYDIHQL